MKISRSPEGAADFAGMVEHIHKESLDRRIQHPAVEWLRAKSRPHPDRQSRFRTMAGFSP
jgi:hypothetical protein